MIQTQEIKKYFFTSLVLHLIILSVLIVSFEFNAPNFVVKNSDQNVLNAIVVNESKISMPNPSPLQPKAEKKPVIKPVMKAEPKPEPKPQPKLTKPAPPVMTKQAIAIPDPRKKQMEKDLLHQQLLDDLKKQTVKKKKVKIVKHHELVKEFEKELKASAASTLQNDLQSEKSRISSAQAQKMQGIVNKYKALILQAIGQHWLVPGGVDKSLSTELLIRVAQGGVVLDVQLVKTSGDSSLDRSARSAVFKASPLPVPSAPDEFEPFKEFILKVKPENIVARDNGLN